jgi:acetyl-CoA carboxylase biotin carboxyl carrier protein
LDLKQIKQIIDLMKRSELTEFAVEEEGFKLKIRRGTNGLPIGFQQPRAPIRRSCPPDFQAPPPRCPCRPPHPAPSDRPPAPHRGTGYHLHQVARWWGPSTGRPPRRAKPFVDVGSKIEENTLVCIIEAMKIMNEIQAETKGTVVEILVENGQPVEYGQRLFKLKQG